MKLYISIILILVCFAACSKNTESDRLPLPANTPPVTEIEAAVKDFYSKTRLALDSKNGNEPFYPPYKVYGVSLERKNDEFYVVSTDVEKPDGTRAIEQTICRKFVSDGKSYWKAEEYNQRLIKRLGRQD
jgi:hypothetical protein